jgi:lipocalin
MAAGNVPEIASEPQSFSKEVEKAETNINLEEQKPIEVLPDENAMHGVKTAEAITLAWTKKSLVAVYIW